jgi:hypothetical protein
MKKSDKTNTAFQRFENFARTLIAVPRKELQEQLAKHERQKKPKRRRVLRAAR